MPFVFTRKAFAIFLLSFFVSHSLTPLPPWGKPPDNAVPSFPLPSLVFSISPDIVFTSPDGFSKSPDRFSKSPGVVFASLCTIFAASACPFQSMGSSRRKVLGYASLPVPKIAHNFTDFSNMTKFFLTRFHYQKTHTNKANRNTKPLKMRLSR